MRRALYPLAAVVIAAVSALVPFGCGRESAVTDAGAHLVRVTVRDFRINAPKRVPAGDVVFAVTNKGPDDHELLVVREPGGEGAEEEGEDETLLRADGLTVDEDGLGPALVDGLEPGEPGVRHLRVKLKPGHYELLCNMAGHYYGGMERELEVR